MKNQQIHSFLKKGYRYLWLSLLAMVSFNSSLLGQLAQGTMYPTSYFVPDPSWSTGNKKVLCIMVNSPDDTSVSQSPSQINSNFVGFNNDYFNWSYGKVTLAPTIVPLPASTAPDTKSYLTTVKSSSYSTMYYKVQGYAINGALAQGYNPDDYDRAIIYYSVLNNAAGRGGKFLSLQNGGFHRHEMGHTFGLGHANAWLSTDEGIIHAAQLNNGTSKPMEYKAIHDEMAFAGIGDAFNVCSKHQLGWLTDPFIQTVPRTPSTVNTYRLEAFDVPSTLTPGKTYALKINKDNTADGSRDYWIEFRQNSFTTVNPNQWANNGVFVYWSPFYISSSENGLGGTCQLDMSPGSPAIKSAPGSTGRDAGMWDAPLLIGQTFHDDVADIYITPLGKSGTSPQAMDVAVNVGPFPNNHAPTLSISADTLTPLPGQAVNLTAFANDPDGDTLAYHWDFGDTYYDVATSGTAPDRDNTVDHASGNTAFNTVSSQYQTKNWGVAGEYLVRCTVTDMKGGTTSAQLIVTVGAPATVRIMGRITLNGAGIADVRVDNGRNSSPYVVGYTDANGYYTMVGVSNGSYTLTAYKYGYSFSRNGFTNPLSVSGSSLSNINFTATPTLTIPTTSLLSSTAGTVYLQQLDRAGGQAPYTWTITGGALPTGLSMDTNGQISGVPIVPGSYSVTVKVTDSTGRNASKTLTSTISSPISITTAATLPSMAVGTSYYSWATSPQLATANGTGQANWSVASGSLPPGLKLLTDGIIYGKPTSGGTYTFTLQAVDGFGSTDSRTFTLQITGGGSTNNAPVANSQSVTTNEDTAKAITLTGSDVDGDTLTYSFTSPAHGTLSGTAPNLTYTPALNYNGSDSFTFKVNDGTVDSATATVSITVTAVNDVPVATAQSVTTSEDTPKAIVLSGTDVESFSLTYTVVTQPAHGLLVGTAPNLTYTPDANYNGLDSFTFKVNDGTVDSAVATVSITVTAVNDAPVANAQSVTTSEDTAVAVTLTGSDVDGDALTYSATSPAHGTLSGTAPNLTYTPSANYNGSDSFTFKVNDGTVDSAVVTVSITVTAVNDAPVANAQSVTTSEDTAKAVTLTGSDVDGDTLTYSFTSPTHGTLSGTAPNLTYTPALNYSGSDSFTFKVNDGAVDSTAATVSITVTSVNHAPVANAQSVTTSEDAAQAITLTGSDIDGNALTYSFTSPAHGTLTGTAPSLTYTPSANYNGSDSFTFKVNDGTVDSAVATVSITVTAVNDTPVANAQSVTTSEDTAVAVVLTGSDVDGDVLTYSVVTSPAHGTLTGTAPNLTYTPSANYNGSDSFTFKANDGTINSAVATVSITVTAVNDTPVANAQSVTTSEDTAVAVTLTGSDVDGDALTYSATSPAHGTLSGTAPNLTYTPTAGYTGADSFTFKVNDGTVDSASATVSISVNATGGAPTIAANGVSPNTGVTTGGTSVTITGTNLTGATSVTIGNVATTNISVNSSGTQLTCVTGIHAAGKVNVIVTTPSGTYTSYGSFTYVLPPPPTITSISPAAGTAGTAITITGTNLAGTISVNVGGSFAKNMVVVSGTQVTCTVPDHVAGTVDVLLKAPGGSVTSVGGFTYQ